MGKDPNLPLESGDWFIFDSLDREVDAVKIDILDAFFSGLCGNDQLFIVFFFEKPPQFRVGIEFVAKVFSNAFESIFLSKQIELCPFITA